MGAMIARMDIFKNNVNATEAAESASVAVSESSEEHGFAAEANSGVSESAVGGSAVGDLLADCSGASGSTADCSSVGNSEMGKLVICPTPIGNLGDMTDRALRALREADAVCAEDTRVTGKLLAAFGIEKRVERLDEAMIGQRMEGIMARIAAGEVIAYCSDAGMPGVSDPGLRLVKAAHAVQLPVEVLPGATAVATAYVASGCDNPRFYFGGFFPRKDTERKAVLDALRALDAALIFYESPNRLTDALDAIAAAYPLREVTVCRELTKLHEEVRRGATADVLADFRAREEAAAAGKGAGIKGEIVLVIDGPSAAEEQAQAETAESSARERAAQLAAEGVRKKQIAKMLAEEFGIPRNAAYDIALEV